MNRKSINVFGTLYILLLSMNIFILFIIYNWINTLYYTSPNETSLPILVSDINLQINIAFLGTLLIIISVVLLFIKKLSRSSTLGFIGNILQLILLFSPPIVFYGQKSNMEPDKYIQFTNEFGSISVFYLLCFCLIFLINIMPLLYDRFKQDIQETAIIHRVILDLGTKYTKLQVKEIAETCKNELNTKIELNTIIKKIREMIANNEIYAQYFRSTNSVVFNQQSNIEEIDKLMNKYSKWEEKEKKK